jgi:hypothetical protein
MNAKLQYRIVLLAALLGAGTIFAACGHDHEPFYSSLADADKNGEITRGWVPEFLPKSSRDIHLAYDLSPSREWCGFQFDPADSASLNDKLKPADQLPESVRTIPNPRVSWWPRILIGDLKIDEIRRSGLQLYVFTRPANAVDTATYLFAVDWKKERGFFFTQ